METSNYPNRFEQSIRGFIEKLLDFLMKCKNRTDKIQKEKERLRLLDESNFGFRGILNSTRENNKMLMYLIIGALCILIDFFLLFNGLTLLSNKSHISLAMKICLPILLVIAEVGISYFSIIRQGTGEYVSWLSKNLQYFVIVILIAFSITVILYSGQGYNSQFDGNSYVGYIIGTVITQIVLLIPAVMLHLWIIKNAEEIADAIAYFKYKIERKKIIKEIEKSESAQKGDQSIFVKRCHNLVQQLESFKRRYPTTKLHFNNTMPAVLIIAINTAMGRKIFNENGSSDLFDLKNYM